MSKIDHYCSWCKKFLFSEERDDFEEDTQTHGMCEECELKDLREKIPRAEEKLAENGNSVVALILKKMKKRLVELENKLENVIKNSMFDILNFDNQTTTKQAESTSKDIDSVCWDIAHELVEFGHSEMWHSFFSLRDSLSIFKYKDVIRPPATVRRYLNKKLPKNLIVAEIGRGMFKLVPNRFVSQGQVFGRWMHVVNGDFSNFKTFLPKFMAIRSEVCFSSVVGSYTSQIGGGSFLAIVVDGPAQMTFKNDIYSHIDPWTGRRYTDEINVTLQTGNTHVQEAWVIPAESTLVCILTDNKNFIKDSEEMGVSVFGSSGFIDPKPEKEPEPKEWEQANKHPLGEGWASDSIVPVSLMRLTQIDDPDELLKDNDRDNIIIEEKLDGFKCQAIKTGDEVHLYTRRGEEKTDNFPELIKALQNIPNETFLEGELVYWYNNKQDIGKVTSLAGSKPATSLEKAKELPGKIKLHLYDILWFKGKNISEKPFSERRKTLQSAVKPNDLVLITKQYPFSEWEDAMNDAVESGGEGIVLKLKDKPYEYKAKGENEPKPKNTMFKYKGGVGKSESDDYVVYDYETTDKGNLKALFGQYYRGKLYHISDIGNFSKENETLIKRKLQDGSFLIEVGFQERVPGGLRHQKFIRFRDDKKPKDATMNEFHVKNIDEFEVVKANDNFKLSKRAETLTPSGLLQEFNQLAPVKPMSGISAPSVPAGMNFDPELGFQIMSKLESGGKSWVRGDSGNSFGLTQVHGPYFMKWLSKNPQLKNITGIDPQKLSEMSNAWKDNMRHINQEKNLWKTVPVDQESVSRFIQANPTSVVKRREGTTIRMNPGNVPGVVKKVGDKYVGMEINLKLLEDKYDFKLTPTNIASIQNITSSYITPLVAKSALAQLLSAQYYPEDFEKFYKTFSGANIRKDPSAQKLSDWVSRSDFMAKMRFLVNSVSKYGYNTNAPGAYNMYQLMCISNGSGPYRVERFLKNRQYFGAAHLHYLQRANPYIRKITGLDTNVVDGGAPGFPNTDKEKRFAFLSKKGKDEFDSPPPYSGQAGAIRNLIEKWLNHKADLSEFPPYGVLYVGKDVANNALYLTLSRENEQNISPFMPEKIGGFTIKYQQPPSNIQTQDPDLKQKHHRYDEFDDEPTVVDPLKGVGVKYYSQILKDYEWYKENMNRVLYDLESRYGHKFTEEEAAEAIVNTLIEKYSKLSSESQVKIILQKWASYVEPSTLYFPGQYAEDIKSGKRRMSIRPGDVNVKPNEQVKCKSYSGADIADVKILAKKVMSITRIEKAYGKGAAKSLSRRFGPDKRFVIIEFEPISINVADDGDDQEKMSETLINKDKKLTRGQIKKHYMKPEVRKKIMARIKGKPVLVYIGTEENEKILKRNHNGKEIVITNDDPKNDESPDNYFYWVKRRLLSIHQVFGTKTSLGFVDLDIHGDFSLDRAKKYAKELAGKLKSKYNTTPTIYNSGGSGLHIEFKLGSEVSIDKLRGELKKLLDEFNEDWDDITTGVVKGTGMRSDVSTLHNKGSIRVPGSFGESNGNIKEPLGGNQDTAENNYINAPLWENKYKCDTEVPFPDSNIFQTAPPQTIGPYEQHGAYNTVDDALVLSKPQKNSNKKVKEYIWIWDANNERLIYNLNIDNGEFTDHYIGYHTNLAKNNMVKGEWDSDLGFRGFVFFFEGEKDGEVHLYSGEVSEMPYKLKKSLGKLSKNEDPKLKEIDLQPGSVGELWKQQEKQRLLEQHLEKRRWMGKEGPDPEFVKDLEIKFASVKKRVLILTAPEDFYESELFASRKVFVEKYGFITNVVSIGDTAKGYNGTIINVDKKLSDVKVKRYDALFVCGGKGMIGFSKNKAAQQLLKEFVEQEKPIGMVCHAPLLAAEANIINGLEITGWPDIVGKIKRANGLWTGMPIERSGFIFTAVGSNEVEDLAHIVSNFVLGGKITTKNDKPLDWKKAQSKLERIWKVGASQDDDEVKKFLEEHPEFEEEEEPEEIETEQERLERAIAPVKPKLKKEIEKPEEPIELEEPIESDEPDESEEDEEEMKEELLKTNRPKYVGFKDMVRPEEEKPKLEEDKYDELFEPAVNVKWEDTFLEEYEDIEGEEEDITEEKVPIFGKKLEPPVDKNGNILNRWFEPEEIERPFMTAEAKSLFTPDNMKDGPALTKLFQDPDAWKILKNNPEIAQKWILPAVIAGIGKRWFDNNSTQLKLGSRDKSGGRTPFGMFDEGDIRLLSKGTSISDLPSSKVYISMINEIVTDLANTYFSFGYRVDPPRGSLPLGGYIYKSLSREMAKHIASDKGYKEIRVPVCSYCKSRKQKRQSREVVYHAMEYIENSKPKRWICSECKRKFEENEDIISTLQNESDIKNKEIANIQKKLTKTVAELANNPTDELKEKRKNYEDQIVSLATDIKHTRTDLENFKKTQYSLGVHIQGVPYWHTWCPNPNCPGNRVPLTAIDRAHEFWQTESGIKAAEILQKRFGISMALAQQAEDTEVSPNILPQRIPPDELLDVPFICPHDYVKFTLRSARGKGLQKKGGFFWEPWQHMLWDRIGKEEVFMEEEGMGGVEANQEENFRNQIVQKTSLYLSTLGAKLFNDQYKTAIQEYNRWFTKQVGAYREKGKPVIDAVKKIEQSGVNGSKQRLLSMYQTLGETSYLDPGMFVSWLSEVSVGNEFVSDAEGNIEERNITEKIKVKDRRDNVYIPTLHAWVSKMADSRSDWFEYYKVEDVLANQKADGIYSNGPGTFFIVKVGDETIEEDNDVVFGFGCNLVPSHKEYNKVSPFSYRMTEEEEKWTVPSKNPKKVPLRQQASLKPKVLKFIGLWKLSTEQIGFVNKHQEWMSGNAPIPLNNKVVEYAKTHPEENLAGEIMYSDYYRVALNETDSSFGVGEYVLVQALVMPGKYNPEPVVDIRNIRNKSDTHQQIFSKVGALMNERPVDSESKALLREFFEDIENYGDDPEEMKMYMEDLIRGFEDLNKRKASLASDLISNASKNLLGCYAEKNAADNNYELNLAKRLLNNKSYDSFFQNDFHKKYPELEPQLINSLIDNKRYHLFFYYKLNEKHPELELQIVKDLINIGDDWVFFNFGLNKKYPELELQFIKKLLNDKKYYTFLNLKLNKKYPELELQAAKGLLNNNNTISTFFSLKLNEKYPELELQAAKQLLDNKQSEYFFQFNLHEKYPELALQAKSGLKNMLDRKQYTNFFLNKMDEKAPELVLQAAKGLIDNKEYGTFFTYNLNEKYPELALRAVKGLIDNKQSIYFFHNKLDEEYPELALQAAKGLIDNKEYGTFFKYNLNEKYPELNAELIKSIRNLPENYKSDQDPNKNFYTISNSAFPIQQRNSYVENLKRYDFSINTPMKLKENKFEENVLNNIFHQTQSGHAGVGILPYTISWALVSFPKKDEVFVEQIQSDLPTIVYSINKDKEKKQKLEEEYGKENVSDFIRKYANYALVYPYQVIEKIAEFAITNNIKRIKLSSVKDILDVAEVSNTKKAKKVYEDIPKELGFKIEDNYSIYDGDMEELKQRVQKAMVEEKQEKSIQLSKRQKLLNIDKVQEILNNVLKERSNLIQVSNNLSDLMKQIGQLFSVGKISKTEFKMLSGLLPKQVEANLDYIIKKIANYYIDDFKLSKRAKDPLSSYKKKRKFDETSEPEGDVEKKNKHRFVIQEHDASNLHWDLRLENDEGTMSSWALPKHHFPKGKEKLLAIKTEDHPVSYNKFEGTIEKGYGAGEVEIHDSGTYEEIEESKSKIVFKLKGKKEKGTYNIFKTDGDKWMIMEHKKDPHKDGNMSNFYLSKRAKLDRLPIAADPVMWSDEQLIEAVKQPDLFGNDKDKFRLAVEQLSKRGLAKKIRTQDIGEWREHGWWLLMWSGIPLAFYDNISKVNMAKDLLVEDFSKDGTTPEAAQKYEPIHGRLKWKLYKDLYPESAGSSEESDRRRSAVQPEIEELISHPFYDKRRKELAKSTLNIFKAPQGFKPSREAVPSGSRPSITNSDEASDSISTSFEDSIGEIKPEFADAVVDSMDITDSATEKFVSDVVKKLEKRRKAEEAGIDVEKLSDDMESSKTASDQFSLSKRAKHTGAMLAIIAPKDIVKKMRKNNMVKDKEIYDILHMTLLYLGDSSKLNKATIESIKKATEKVCARHNPLEMRIAGAGLFTPGDDGIPVYVVPNAKGLSALQADLENVIGSIIDLPSEHGWAPHMTVSYSCDENPELPNLTEELEWTADKVRLQVGGKKVADISIGSRKKAEVRFPLSKRAMNITKNMIPTLWYENEKGKKYIPDYTGNDPPPNGFIYQHSQFPTTLNHKILRLTVEDEVKSCTHPKDNISPTHGWIDGVEGRKCTRCQGHQTKKVDEPWPKEWSSDGSVDVGTGTQSWPGDLVMAITNSGDWDMKDTILIVANSCERCMNALAHKYGLNWGYPEFGEEWQKARTQCDFCKSDKKSKSPHE